MTIHVDWDNPEQTTLLWTVAGRWTWQESSDAIAKAWAMMESSPLPLVDSIVDMRHGNLVPDNALSNFSRTLSNAHPKTGFIVMAGMPPFIQALLNVYIRSQRASKRKISAVKTLEEARSILKTQHQASVVSSGQL